MKKISVFCVALLLTFASCKKNSGSSTNYHFTATIGGAAQTFNTSPLATSISNGGLTLIAIEGFSTNSSGAQSIALSWNNNVTNATFGIGTYYDTAVNYSTMGVYTASISQSYVSGSTMAQIASGSGTPIANHLKIIITALDSTHVKGTFSGDFYYQEDITGAIKSITSGDFDVPWKK